MSSVYHDVVGPRCSSSSSPFRRQTVPVLPALLEHWQEFLGYLISFVFIGGIWIARAGATKLMKRGDAIAYGINLLMLLFVGVLPFTKNLMVTHLDGSFGTAGLRLEWPSLRLG